LECPPLLSPAIFVAATGPRTLRLSGEIADGTILTASTPPTGVRQARQLIAEGRLAGGRTEAHPVTVYLSAATGPGAAERLAAERQRSGLSSPGDIGVAGDAQAVAQAVRRWADAGADTVVLQPTPDDPDPEGFVRFAAAEVSPLVRDYAPNAASGR
jgi:alkanesulfonate monooxygenase SsuD/methylene tetrahydromethanopterin reductase-like flavin-dependent oxidoreductase (luciferase family)